MGLGTRLSVALAGFLLSLFSPGPTALAAEAASGGSGAVRVKGESDAYRIATPKSPVSLQIRGAGDLTVKLRAVLAAGPMPSEGVKVRIVENGNEKTHLSLSIYAAGSFSDRSDVVPTGPSNRNFRLGEGPHTITIEAKGGNAAVLFRWKAKRVRSRGGRVEPESSPDLAAAPLANEPASAAPLVPAVAPVTQVPGVAPSSPPAAASASTLPAPTANPVAPAPVPPYETEPPPPQMAVAATAPAPVLAVPSPSTAFVTEVPPTTTTTSQAGERSRSPLPLIFVGAAALCAAGGGVMVGLGVSQYSTYNATPEIQGGTPTNRANMLNTANTELAAAEILGAATAAFLLATGVSLFF